jgi:hypothetical protein
LSRTIPRIDLRSSGEQGMLRTAWCAFSNGSTRQLEGHFLCDQPPFSTSQLDRRAQPSWLRSSLENLRCLKTVLFGSAFSQQAFCEMYHDQQISNWPG